MTYKLYRGNTLIKKVYASGGVGFRVCDNYQKFGSPTQDGWNFAGFSANNYLRLNKPVDIGANNYDIKFQFAVADSNEEYQVICNCDSYGLFAFAIQKRDNKLFLHSNSGDGTTWTSRIDGTTPLTVGQVYAARLVKTGGRRYMYLSPGGGENWQLQGSVADPSSSSSGNLWIGRNQAGVQFFNGVIDISRSTISIDGNLNIKKIYRGSQLVWQADPYDPGTTLFYKTGANTFETELEAGVYDLVIAGGGGQGYSWNYGGLIFHNAGGSGAAWEGQFYNPVKQHCKIYAGGKSQDSFLELGGVRMITAQAGQPHQGGSTGSGGPGGVISVNGALQIVQQRKSSNGNQGARGEHNENPTPSVCSLNNWGQGSWTHNDNAGWIAGGARFQYIRLDK